MPRSPAGSPVGISQNALFPKWQEKLDTVVPCPARGRRNPHVRNAKDAARNLCARWRFEPAETDYLLRIGKALKMEGQDWMLDRTKVKEAKAVFSRKIMRGKITDEQHAIELFFMTPIFIQKNQKIAMRIKVEHQEKTAKVQYYYPQSSKDSRRT